MNSTAELTRIWRLSGTSSSITSLLSHKGYIQWQGSTAQELLWDDLDAYLKDPTKKPKDLWLSRDEYKYSFPLEAFRDKIKQEICTEKYLATRRARADGLNV